MLRELIKKEREKLNISIYRLAKDTGLQKTQIGNYLKGKADLYGENIDKILKVLRLEVISTI